MHHSPFYITDEILLLTLKASACTCAHAYVYLCKSLSLSLFDGCFECTTRFKCKQRLVCQHHPTLVMRYLLQDTQIQVRESMALNWKPNYIQEMLRRTLILGYRQVSVICNIDFLGSHHCVARLGYLPESGSPWLLREPEVKRSGRPWVRQHRCRREHRLPREDGGQDASLPRGH